jgi:predicted AAA+ superfamily ATPase
MQINNIIDYLSTNQRRMTAFLPTRLRPFLTRTKLSGKRAATIVGPRGVGKTTLLLHEAQTAQGLYVASDNPLIAHFSLTQIAEAAFVAGYKGVVFDEVHHAHQWGLHCKSLYDTYPDRFIWISDRSSLLLKTGIADLSRRFPKISVPFLSFPEYVALKHGTVMEPCDPFCLDTAQIGRTLRSFDVLTEFNAYKREGLRPIFLEGDYPQKILGIIEKSIYSDIPYFVPQIQDNHIRLMNAVIGHLATSTIPTLNIDSLTTQWGLGKEKLYQLLNVMELVGLISIVRYKSDRHAMTKGAKIFFADPSIYTALGGSDGNLREALVVTMFRQLGKEIFACKDERQGDFTVGNITLEVGGKNKEQKGADFVIRDDLDYPGTTSVPLWVVASMY